MRKFKLLKDLPDCPKGAIGEENSGSVIWRTLRNKPSEPQGIYNLQFAIWHVLANPNWFEEVVERKMCKYEPICCVANWNCENCGNLPKPTPKKIEPVEFTEDSQYKNSPVVVWAYICNLNKKVKEIIEAVNEMRGAV